MRTWLELPDTMRNGSRILRSSWRVKALLERIFVDHSGEASLSNLTIQLRDAAARVQMNATNVNSFIESVPAITQEPARTAVMEAHAGDNSALDAASAAVAAVEAESACTGGGGPYAAAAEAPPYQGRCFDTAGSLYKDSAVVELLRSSSRLMIRRQNGGGGGQR